MRTCKLIAVYSLLTLLNACTGETQNQNLALIFMESPAAAGSAEPHLQAGEDGTVVLSWLEPAKEKTFLRYASFGSGAWSKPQTVASGANWFVNWADFPSVTRIRKDLWAAHWLEKTAANSYAYGIRISLSPDGVSWLPAISPHDDHTLTEHGFVSMIGTGDKVGAV